MDIKVNWSNLLGRLLQEGNYKKAINIISDLLLPRSKLTEEQEIQLNQLVDLYCTIQQGIDFKIMLFTSLGLIKKALIHMRAKISLLEEVELVNEEKREYLQLLYNYSSFCEQQGLWSNAIFGYQKAISFIQNVEIVGNDKQILSSLSLENLQLLIILLNRKSYCLERDGQIIEASASLNFNQQVQSILGEKQSVINNINNINQSLLKKDKNIIKAYQKLYN
ncbi:hypothetical protein ABK040_009524 [Willaertia magna]